VTATRTTTLRLGTRASQLALTQSQHVADALTAASGVPVELVHVSTSGDRSAAAISQLGGTGVFVSALRDALHAGEVDLAVHSYKDLPTAPAPGLALAAVPPREDPRDVLVARDGLTLGELPVGARVGTGAPRRMAQLRALGLGLEVVPIRGNVDTRMGRVARADGGGGRVGDLDAVVLARAGLARLGRLAAVTEVLDPIQVLPAPAQGALAVECRSDDARVIALLAALEDPAARACVAAERSVLTALEAGCSAPVAAYAELAEAEDGTAELYLRGSVTALDGSDGVRGSISGPAADGAELGRRLATELLDRGAAALMAAAR
jgi:hydroxymethylbilane synthase